MPALMSKTAGARKCCCAGSSVRAHCMPQALCDSRGALLRSRTRSVRYFGIHILCVSVQCEGGHHADDRNAPSTAIHSRSNRPKTALGFTVRSTDVMSYFRCIQPSAACDGIQATPARLSWQRKASCAYTAALASSCASR